MAYFQVRTVKFRESRSKNMSIPSPFIFTKAYFPPTFEADGMTHATAVPSRLLDVANHFYQERIRESLVTWRYTLPETNSQFTPENGGPLEVQGFLLETSTFRGKLLVLGRVMGAKSRQIRPKLGQQPPNKILPRKFTENWWLEDDSFPF